MNANNIQNHDQSQFNDDLVGLFGNCSPEGNVDQNDSFDFNCSKHPKSRRKSNKKMRQSSSMISFVDQSIHEHEKVDIDSICKKTKLQYLCDTENRRNSMIESNLPNYLPPEIEEGNIEYKRKLVNLTVDRFEHLVTQLNWRLSEGEGEAIYEIGVEDNGLIRGLDKKELNESYDTLKNMASRIGAQVSILRRRHVSASDVVSICSLEKDGICDCRQSMEVLVKRQPTNNFIKEVRIVLLGNVDAGKSTLVGVLSQAELDNGRGKARLNLFRHPHEMLSGRTSCISSEILLFDQSNQLLNPSLSSRCPDFKPNNHKVNHVSGLSPHWSSSLLHPHHSNAFFSKAKRAVCLIDLAGHRKYQRTTLYGLTSRIPHFALLVLSAVSGLMNQSLDHLQLAIAMQLPLVVVINKIDLAPAAGVIQQLQIWLDKYCNQSKGNLKSVSPPCLACYINSGEMVNKLAACNWKEFFNSCKTPPSPNSHNGILPVFCISCVTGQGLDLLTQFLGAISARDEDNKSNGDESVHFSIVNVHQHSSIKDNYVLIGLIVNGQIQPDQHLFLGPNQKGKFRLVQVVSVYKNKLMQRTAIAGDTASLAIRTLSRSDFNRTVEDSSWLDCATDEPLNMPRRGMVLLSRLPLKNFSHAGPVRHFFCRFESQISSSQSENSKISERLKQWTLYCGAICQTVTLHEGSIMEQNNSDESKVSDSVLHLKFLKYPEYLEVDKFFIYKNGPIQGHGTITKLICDPNTMLG